MQYTANYIFCARRGEIRDYDENRPTARMQYDDDVVRAWVCRLRFIWEQSKHSLFKFEGHLELIKFKFDLEWLFYVRMRWEWSCLFLGQFESFDGGQPNGEIHSDFRMEAIKLHFDADTVSVSGINRQHQNRQCVWLINVNRRIRYCIRLCAAHKKHLSV